MGKSWTDGRYYASSYAIYVNEPRGRPWLCYWKPPCQREAAPLGIARGTLGGAAGPLPFCRAAASSRTSARAQKRKELTPRNAPFTEPWNHGIQAEQFAQSKLRGIKLPQQIPGGGRRPAGRRRGEEGIFQLCQPTGNQRQAKPSPRGNAFPDGCQVCKLTKGFQSPRALF